MRLFTNLIQHGQLRPSVPVPIPHHNPPPPSPLHPVPKHPHPMMTPKRAFCILRNLNANAQAGVSPFNWKRIDVRSATSRTPHPITNPSDRMKRPIMHVTKRFLFPLFTTWIDDGRSRPSVSDLTTIPPEPPVCPRHHVHKHPHPIVTSKRPSSYILKNRLLRANANVFHEFN